MPSYIYVYIDGELFDSEAFLKKLDSSCKGSISSQKQIKNGVVQVLRKYWQSESYEVDQGNLDNGLCTLISRYKESALIAEGYGGTRIIVSVVIEYKSQDNIRGFFLAKETLQLLSELGASLDIDVIRKNKP